ncbi:MAG TPA: cupredoxin domain-containing protein [Actinomycetota bacterium]|nr:cupredoxin domain-containing protein [Actinomycetota bacterium]
MRRSWLVLGLVLALVGASACQREETTGSIRIGGEAANNHGEADVAGESSVEFEVDDFYFEPTVVEGEAGQKVALEAFNEGEATHTFTVDALGIDKTLAPEAQTSIEVTLPDSGALLFYCRFHQSRGMRGALSVGGDLTINTEV